VTILNLPADARAKQRCYLKAKKAQVLSRMRLLLEGLTREDVASFSRASRAQMADVLDRRRRRFPMTFVSGYEGRWRKRRQRHDADLSPIWCVFHLACVVRDGSDQLA
jgi:hypothetical protein